MRNVKLKAAIYESCKTTKQIAEEANMSQALVSLATTGRYDLSDRHKKAIADVLNKSVSDLFNE